MTASVNGYATGVNDATRSPRSPVDALVDGFAAGAPYSVRVPSMIATKAGETVTVAGGAEFVFGMPPIQESLILNLIQTFEVGADVQRAFVLAEADRSLGATQPAELAAKAAGSVNVGGVTVTLAPVAATMQLSKHTLEDRAYLQNLIETRLAEAVQWQAVGVVIAAALADTDIVVIPTPGRAGLRQAQTAVEQGGFRCNGTILNPADWEATETGLPMAMAPVEEWPTGGYVSMFGPIVVAPNPMMTAKKGLLGDLRGLALIHQPTTDLSLSYSHQDLFVRDQVMLRAEQMVAAAVTAPKRLRVVSF